LPSLLDPPLKRSKSLPLATAPAIKKSRRAAAYTFFLKDAIPRLKDQLSPSVSHSSLLRHVAAEWKTTVDKSHWQQLADEANRKLDSEERLESVMAVHNGGKGASASGQGVVASVQGVEEISQEGGGGREGGGGGGAGQ